MKKKMYIYTEKTNNSEKKKRDNSDVAWINKILSIQEQYFQGFVTVT